MNTHHPTPPQRPRYNIGYRTCPQCQFQFTPEQYDQSICKLCDDAISRKRSIQLHNAKRTKPGRTIACDVCKKIVLAKTSNHKYCENCKVEAKAKRKAEKRAEGKKPRPCEVCKIVFWPRSPRDKYCHNPECKKVGLDKSEAKRQGKRKAVV